MLFLPSATTESIGTGLLAMSLLFGLIFGPMLTLGTAAMLAVAGFSLADFTAVGWPRLVMFTLGSCALGIALGFGLGLTKGGESLPSLAV